MLSPEDRAKFNASREALRSTVSRVEHYLGAVAYGDDKALFEADLSLEETFFGPDTRPDKIKKSERQLLRNTDAPTLGRLSPREHYRSVQLTPSALTATKYLPENEREPQAAKLRQDLANLVVTNMVEGSNIPEEAFPLVLEAVFDAKKQMGAADFARRTHIDEVRDQIMDVKQTAMVDHDNATVGRADTVLSLLPDLPMSENMKHLVTPTDAEN